MSIFFITKIIEFLALFDLPDEINFGKECPVRCENSKAMLVTNVGRKSSKFTVACTGSYFVKPEQGYLVSGQCMQLDVCFLPKVRKNTRHHRKSHSLFLIENGQA